MRVLKVYSKETFAEVEFSMQQIKHILDFLDKCSVKYNSKEEPSLVEASEYVTNDFLKTLDSLYNEFNKGP